MHLKEVKAGLSAGYICALMVTRWDDVDSARKALDFCRRDYSGTFILVRGTYGDSVARVVESVSDLEHWSTMWSLRKRSVAVMKKRVTERDSPIAVLLPPSKIIDANKDALIVCSATLSNIIDRLSKVNG